MLAVSSVSAWHRCLASSASVASAKSEAIRPYRIHVDEARLTDLRKRIADTRWPDKETVNDVSQGVQRAQAQELVKYWGNGYDWRKAEAKLNALPEFITTIDGVDIQFIHVRSRNPNAMPLILTHGWPGSQFEFLKTIGPLTDPTAYGGRAEDSFDVVIASIPGHGFSGKPTELGWGPDRVAKAWDVLMKRLGYSHYVSQGGDHGSVISDALGRLAPPGLLGIHLNMPATVPPELGAYPSLSYFSEVNKGGHFAAWEQPQLFSEELREAFRPLRTAAKNAGAQATR
ncbi:epoxide hydrolase 1 [Pseudomonas frederiksbergensis]|uniref:epoxide hydrolase family protein n=1 Tax=Pseudomonas frederiksbergensis TaxID=104087 RepID=UPI00197E2A44|nr:epoxide hydrolase [Pseudomonas frederiksbergensis]MBN3862483.1 epoxide hydrolase 1 [Pseudomonas frederiksbergensis]